MQTRIVASLKPSWKANKTVLALISPPNLTPAKKLGRSISGRVNNKVSPKISGVMITKSILKIITNPAANK